VDFANDLPPDGLDEITSLLASGFLRYWKSQRLRPLIAENLLDSPATESPDGTVVNAKRTGEK
jgi:hypothetical protein